MYKIIGNFHGEKINEVYITPEYAIGVYLAYVEKWMPSQFSAEAVSNFPHQLKLNNDVWLELCEEV